MTEVAPGFMRFQVVGSFTFVGTSPSSTGRPDSGVFCSTF